jgi:hypothetical protein
MEIMCLTSRLGCFTPGNNPGTHCIGGWVGPQSRPGRFGEMKKLVLTGFRIPARRTCSLVAIPTELLRLQFYLKSTIISFKHVNIYLIYFISSGSVEPELQISALLTDAFGGFPQPLTQMAYSTSTCAYPLLSTSSPIRYSLIIVSPFAVCTCVPRVSQCPKSLNKWNRRWQRLVISVENAPVCLSGLPGMSTIIVKLSQAVIIVSASCSDFKICEFFHAVYLSASSTLIVKSEYLRDRNNRQLCL